MDRGDIYRVSLDPTEGREQNGTCPVMIITRAAFNQVTGVPVVVPITSGGNFARVRGFAVPLDGAGTKTYGVVRCDQPRAMALAERKAVFVEKAPQEIIDEVLARVQAVLLK